MVDARPTAGYGQRCSRHRGGVGPTLRAGHSKTDRDLSTDAAKSALAGLQPVTFHYKNSPDEEYAGFIAEDVPEVVATNDRQV